LERARLLPHNPPPPNTVRVSEEVSGDNGVRGGGKGHRGRRWGGKKKTEGHASGLVNGDAQLIREEPRKKKVAPARSHGKEGG